MSHENEPPKWPETIKTMQNWAYFTLCIVFVLLFIQLIELGDTYIPGLAAALMICVDTCIKW